jgi:hypothetical protein
MSHHTMHRISHGRGPVSARRLRLSFVACIAAWTASGALQSLSAPIGYYPFNVDANDYDNSGNANNLSLVGVPVATITAGNQGMFGEALSTTGGTGVAQLLDASAADFDTTFANFSVGFWAKPDSWTDTSAVRLLTGKTTGSSSQRGWVVQKTNAAINQLQFVFFNAASGGTQVTVSTALAAALSNAEYTHIAATFGVGGSSNAKLYVNGIQRAAVTTAVTVLNGSNSGNFEVGNRGTQTSTNAYTGLIDDYGIASDTIGAQQIALTHGLGRLAAVSLGDLNQALTNTQILDVLAAYNSQTSAVAGTGAAAGTTWYYSPNVGGGTTIGTIGGTVAGNDAFVVLGTDGSGVTLVPEPSSIALFGMALCSGCALARRRR